MDRQEADPISPLIFNWQTPWHSSFQRKYREISIPLYLTPSFPSDSTQFGWANLQVFDLDDAPSPFDAWRAEHFSAEELDDPEISGEHAAPAGDGVPNLLKYALGLDPRSPAAPEELPALSIDDEHLALVYRPDADAAGVALVPEVSDNLLDWESGDGFVEVTEESVNGTTVVQARSVDSIADRSSLFIRLRAEREP